MKDVFDSLENYPDFKINRCPVCGKKVVIGEYDITHCCGQDLIKSDLEEYGEDVRKSGIKNSDIMTIENFKVFARVEKYGCIDLHKCPACGTEWIPPEVVTHLGKQWFKCAYCNTKLVTHKGKLDIKKWVDRDKKRSKEHKQMSLFK